MSKRHIPPLEAGRVRLRLLEESDLPRTLAWRNQDHVRRWFFFSDPITTEQHAAWFARYRERDDDFVFVIEVGWAELASPTNRTRETVGLASSAHPTVAPIGQVALYDIDWSSGRAEFGRLMIGEANAAGRGFAREATDAVLDLAFGRLGSNEVYLDVIPSNERAIKIYEACGFAVTGRTKKIVSMSKRSTQPILA